MYFVNSQTSPNAYLNQYNKLYLSQKFETRIEYTYYNLTFKFSTCLDVNRDCAGNGICSNKTIDCICNPGYASILDSYVKCTYQQKSKTTALLLELLIGFGFGHMYIGNYVFFIAKFLFYFFSCYFNFCVMIFIGSVNNSNVNDISFSTTKRNTIILVPIIIGWYLFDILMFLCGSYYDSNGIQLY